MLVIAFFDWLRGGSSLFGFFWRCFLVFVVVFIFGVGFFVLVHTCLSCVFLLASLRCAEYFCSWCFFGVL